MSKGTFTDPRDGRQYRTVVIGRQEWLAENLAYDCEGSKVYGNDLENLPKYGRLYDWEAANKAAPEGWRLPSKEEWEAAFEGLTFKEQIELLNLLPGGEGYSGGNFDYAGLHGYWWSATEFISDSAYDRGMDFYHEFAFWLINDKYFLFSVRCLRDKCAE
jgi:formylglycine-generating enzyme required for sulfatase activity